MNAAADLPPVWTAPPAPRRLAPAVAEARLRVLFGGDAGEGSASPASPADADADAVNALFGSSSTSSTSTSSTTSADAGLSSMLADFEAVLGLSPEAIHKKALELDVTPERAAEILSRQKTVGDWLAENVVNASTYLETDPPPVDPIIENMFERGDLVAVIAPSKCRKSFTVLQMAVCIAGGWDFLGLRVPQSRRVCVVQFEVQPGHYHRRVKRMCAALRSDPHQTRLLDIGGRLHIVNARGKGFHPDMLPALVQHVKADLVILDPLYKMMPGAENGAEDMKPIFDAFDKLAHETGCAVCYVHHDAKGDASAKSTRDRGSGSGVIGRAYDACLTIDEHQEEDHAVFEMLLRNYAPRPAFSAMWADGAWRVSDRPAAKRKTSPSANPTSSRPAEEFFPAVRRLLTSGPLSASQLDSALRDDCGLTKIKAAEVRDAAVSAGVSRAENVFGKGKLYHFS